MSDGMLLQIRDDGRAEAVVAWMKLPEPYAERRNDD